MFYAPFHLIAFVLFFPFLSLLVLAGLVWLIVSLTRGTHARPLSDRTALETLDHRYARGEVSRDEYLQARDDLGGR